jgi:hypothetical protein
MNTGTVTEMALGRMGLVAAVGVPPETPGAVSVVALCDHKVDGVVAYKGQHYWQERARAQAGAARNIVHLIASVRVDWWKASGRVLSPFAGDTEAVYSRSPAPGSLKIVQGCGYDPGSSAYRYHSAVNQCTQHSSAFVRYEDLNPHCSLRQYDGVRDAAVVREALLSADVVHCHMNYMLAANALPRSRSDERTVRPVHWRAGQWIVRHYHGSRPDGRTNMEHRIDDGVRARAQTDGGGLVRVGARLTLCAEPDAGDVEWLPIAMPVARYRALRNEVGPTIARGIRIAHSPTKRLYKGTDKFMAAVASLKAKGLDVQAVLIENKDHGTALRMKAGCDAVFDSLWLGLQGSGLEGGAMGLPCIAGDPDVAALYKAHVGSVPYTFAGDQAGIANAIERLATDADFYAKEAARLSEYVTAYHDYPSVAKRYEGILAKAMNRPDVITTAVSARKRRAAA